MRNLMLLTLLALAALFLVGCATTNVSESNEPQSLTQGAVQMNLVVGSTSKAEVLEVFGAPNVTTRDGSGREVWSYQRQAQVSQSTSQSSGWSILLAGSSRSASGLSTSSRMITLIIKFDENDVVSDFRSRTSNF